MIYQNSSWNDKSTVKKGNIGEQIVSDFLIKNGYIPYVPDFNGPHPFDRLVASQDKKRIFIADIKTKAMRKFYPDTGIDIRHYQEYKYIQDKYNIDVFIFFVDEETERIYGNYLRRLDAETTIIHNNKNITYPLEQGNIRYFPIASMTQIASISESDSRKMKELTTKKEDYRG